jgi:hypothetical protein
MSSAVIAVASSALFFLNHRAMPGYDTSDLARPPARAEREHCLRKIDPFRLRL